LSLPLRNRHMSIGFSSFLNPNAIEIDCIRSEIQRRRIRIDVRESTEDPLVNGLYV